MADQKKHRSQSMGVQRAMPGSSYRYARSLEEEAEEAEEQWNPLAHRSRESLRIRAEMIKEKARLPKKRREEFELGRSRAKQTVIVKKSAAKSRKEAAKLADKYADRVYTSRGTKNTWRFRQRPPECFVPRTLKTWCKPGNGVCVVYGTLKKGADKRNACK